MSTERSTGGLRGEVASALDPMMERERGDGGPHPAVDELIRYHGGELAEAEEERVRRHLVACAECQADLLDLDGFVNVGRERREGTFPAPAVTSPVRPAAPRPFALSRGLVALAASLLVAVLALGVWVVLERQAARDLRQQVASLSAPRADVPIVDLLPDSIARGEQADRAPVAWPPGDELVTFVLNLPRAPEVSGFEVDLVGPGGEVTWSGPVERSRYGTFTLGVWRRHLTPGENRVLLHGVGPEGRRLLETYTFRVDPPAP